MITEAKLIGQWQTVISSGEHTPRIAPSASEPPVSGVASRSATFDEIYDATFAFVWRNARRLGVPDAALDDAVQDVFVVVHRRFAEYDHSRRVESWLFGILARVVRDYRRRFRRKEMQLVSTETQLEVAAFESSTEDRTDATRLVRLLLEQLDDEKREILVMAELEQMTVPEIAESLGINVNTAYSRVRAARRAFDDVRMRFDAKDAKDAKSERGLR